MYVNIVKMTKEMRYTKGTSADPDWNNSHEGTVFSEAFQEKKAIRGKKANVTIKLKISV
jgi:hypothetical protein